MRLSGFGALVASIQAAPSCVNQDDVFARALEQQTGQRLDCEDFRGIRPEACDDPAFSSICCAACAEDPEGKNMRWERLAEQQEEVRAQLSMSPPISLRGGGSGSRMPALALGTGNLPLQSVAHLVEYALRSGYRAVDTAVMYGNHVQVGMGLRASSVPREEVFLTSKVPPNMMGYEMAMTAVRLMLDEMQVTYVDLCLLHWPHSHVPWLRGKRVPGTLQVVERAGAWRALEKAHDLGHCRHIGVSNFMVQHLRELLSYARVPPAVNQIEYHPYQVDRNTTEFCRRHGLAVQAYGSMFQVLKDPTVLAIAQEVGRTPAQVLLRWGVQEGVMVLARSSKEARVLENAKIWDFELEDAQQRRLGALHRDERTWDNPHDSPAIRAVTRRANPF